MFTFTEEIYLFINFILIWGKLKNFIFLCSDIYIKKHYLLMKTSFLYSFTSSYFFVKFRLSSNFHVIGIFEFLANCQNLNLFLILLFQKQPPEVCAFHFVEIFYFVEIQPVFCLYLQNVLEFFNLILQL